MNPKTFTTDRVPLPPGFRMFILPEYRLVTPSYSVKLSRCHGAIVTVLLANYERSVLRSEMETILWGHLEDGGPDNGANTISVMLWQIRTKLRSVGIDVTFTPNRWHRRNRALTASGLAECQPVGRLDNPARLKALRDRRSPNPSRGLPKENKAPVPRPRREPAPKREDPLPETSRYSYVERPRPQAVWRHNARAEAYFGDGGPK